jgi:hypothetical protein
MLTHKDLKAHALERVDVKAEYDRLDEEFAILDEFLKPGQPPASRRQNLRGVSARHSPLLHVWNQAVEGIPPPWPRCVSTHRPSVVVWNSGLS